MSISYNACMVLKRLLLRAKLAWFRRRQWLIPEINSRINSISKAVPEAPHSIMLIVSWAASLIVVSGIFVSEK